MDSEVTATRTRTLRRLTGITALVVIPSNARDLLFGNTKEKAESSGRHHPSE
jgi:hypothetical protein